MFHVPSFDLFVQVAVVGFLTGAVYALMVSGLTLIFGVMRVINIAHGAFLVLGGYLSYWLWVKLGWDPFLSIVLTVPLFFLLGIFTQRVVLSRVRPEPGFVVLTTFALAITMEGLMAWRWDTTVRSVRTGYVSDVVAFTAPGDVPLRLPVVRILGFVGALLVLGVLWLILNRTKLGRAIRATMENPEAAQLVGVNVERVKGITFGLGVASVAIGGAMFSMIWTFNGSSHIDWISRMLVIVVLGGMGSLSGALIAALLMGTIEAVSEVVISVSWAPIIFLLILFIVLTVRPQGLRGERLRET